jgi:MFS transporter, DHA2 family, multidrug resistance protein
MNPHSVPNRGIITVCLMAATLMQALDSTIANVALPYMQGSLAATSDQITWVLTSYVIAAAIMTAPVGWLAMRFGRKQLFIACLAGFTVASMACGAAQSLPQMVLFRLAQGVFGAALVPLSQATLLDIYPMEQRGQAMAIWGMGVMVGPILGPTLGGYLTEFYNWRWVFYVNLPFGIMAIAGLVIFMPRGEPNSGMRFDWTGFMALALGVGALQMMLDRGETKDWFGSREIIVEAVLAGTGLYLFLVHIFTAEKPFIPPRIFRNGNYSSASGLMFSIGVVLLASSALLAPFLQTLAGYPVESAGLIMAPRGIGTMVAMMMVGRLTARMDPRKLMGFGVLVMSWSFWRMSTWTPDVGEQEIIFTIVIQGFAMGFVFVPMQVMAFATLDPALRGDGTALLSLFRNIGSAIGVSITELMLARNQQIVHAALASVITPFNRILGAGPGAAMAPITPLGSALTLPPVGLQATVTTPFGAGFSPNNPFGAAILDKTINFQASVIGYMNDYRLMVWTSLPAVLLLFLMRRPGIAAKPPPHEVME